MLDIVVQKKNKKKILLTLKLTIKMLEEGYETGSYSEKCRQEFWKTIIIQNEFLFTVAEDYN